MKEMTINPFSREAMMMETNNDYGLWFLVTLNSVIFVMFAFSFSNPIPHKTVADLVVIEFD